VLTFNQQVLSYSSFLLICYNKKLLKVVTLILKKFIQKYPNKSNTKEEILNCVLKPSAVFHRVAFDVIMTHASF